MKAIIYKNPGDPEVLEMAERPIPEIQSYEVLIKVVAAGLNRADLAQRKGNYPAPKGTVQDIPGLEVSGIIEKTGSAVTQWKPGDEVCALLPGGGYAEYVSVDAGSCLPIPKGFSVLEAAALPEVVLTVWQNIFQIGQLKPEEKVMIYGGSGGIGSMAIQLVSLFGAKARSLASSDEKINFCKDLGAERVFNYKTEDLNEAIGKNQVDLILDSVGGKYLDLNLNILKPEGRLVYINAMDGNFPLNIFKLMQKRIHITGSTLRARSLSHKAQLVREVIEKAYPLLEHENFKKTVHYTFPLKNAVETHQLMESRDFYGKILLTL